MINVAQLLKDKFILKKTTRQSVSVDFDLNELKENVIHGNEYEINKASDQLKKLRRDLRLIALNYCRQKGHRYVLTDYTPIGRTGWHSFVGDQMIFDAEYECSVCGDRTSKNITCYGYPTRHICEEHFPRSAYDDDSLQIDGRTYRMIQDEISQLTDYIAYRQCLKTKICELTGHTMRSDGYSLKCICCGISMTRNQYSHYLEDNHISFTRETFLLLPTFEDYQRNVGLEPNHRNDYNGNKQTKIR